MSQVSGIGCYENSNSHEWLDARQGVEGWKVPGVCCVQVKGIFHILLCSSADLPQINQSVNLCIQGRHGDRTPSWINATPYSTACHFIAFSQYLLLFLGIENCCLDIVILLLFRHMHLHFGHRWCNLFVSCQTDKEKKNIGIHSDSYFELYLPLW